MRIPDGAALILTGSGIYWVLSSQLIASFSVLTPELFQTNSQGILLVLTTGVVSSAAGLWGIGSDLEKLRELFSRREGWLYTVPIILAVSDISLTLVGLRARPGIVELNPFVVSAIEAGAAYLISFTICYILMSEGLALLLLDWGRWLFARTPALAYLPFCLICGTAALGPFSNIALITISDLGALAFLLGLTGAAALAASLYYGFGQARRFSLMEGPKGSSP